MASKQGYFIRWPINMLIRQTKIQPLERQTAREFMYGYPTTLTTLGNTFLPSWISFDKVGLIDRVSSVSSGVCSGVLLIMTYGPPSPVPDVRL